MSFMEPVTRPIQDRRALRISEFCAAYGISRATAYRLMAKRKLPTVMIGGRRLVPVDVAEALLQGAA